MLQLYKTISPKLTFRKSYHFSLKHYNFNYSLNSDKFLVMLIKMNFVLNLFLFRKIKSFIVKINLFFICILVKKEKKKKKTNSLRKYLKEVMLKNRCISLSPP